MYAVSCLPAAGHQQGQMQAQEGAQSASMQLISSFMHLTNFFHFINRFGRCSVELYSLSWGLVITACTLWYRNLSRFHFDCRQQAVDNSLISVPKTGTMLLLVAVLKAKISNASLLLDQGLDNFT